MPRPEPPFRADQVGSLLRPPELLEARRRLAEGEIDRAALREVEDAAIREAVAFQEGLAHFRRVATGETISRAPPKLVTAGKLAWPGPIMGADFDFLKSVTRRTP